MESCIILPIGFNLFLIEGTTIPFQIVLVPECQNIPALLDVRNGQVCLKFCKLNLTLLDDCTQ